MLRTRSRGYELESHKLDGTVTTTQTRVSYFPTFRENRLIVSPLAATGVKFSNLSQISDSIMTPNRFNGCAHDRYYPFVVALDGDSILDTPLNSELPANQWITVGSKSDPIYGSYSIDSHLGSNGWPTIAAPIDWSTLVTDVGARLDGSMTASTNMLVVVGELAETIGMFKNPFGLLTTNWSRALAKGKTLRQLSKAGANVWLEYKYGWKNFFLDFNATLKAAGEARKHVEYLMSTRDAYSSVGKSQHDESTYSLPLRTIGSVANGAAVTVSDLRIVRDATFSLDILRGEAFRVLSQPMYMMQRLGTNQLIPALWDLVPMSFVVDWFVDLQRYLKLNLAYSGMHNLRNIGYSVKTSWFASLIVDCELQGWAGHTKGVQGCYPEQLVRKLYTRSAGFPPQTESEGIFGGLNLVHLADASALVAQRIF